jgi:3-deoxy-7-phosphoheptulonate synthase
MPQNKSNVTGQSPFDFRDYAVSEAQAMRFRIGRGSHPKDVVVRVGDLAIGGGKPVLIAGPCSVDAEKPFLKTVEALAKTGVGLVRANLFKFRTLPSSFQGLGERGIDLLAAAKEKFGVRLVSEVMDAEQAKALAPVVDVFQVGARSMMNTSLLKTLSRERKPVLLKRLFAATLGEFLAAAEYIAEGGNLDIILCERGIRSFDPWVRFTLDVPGIALLRKVSCLPVIADVSHSLGRTDVAAPLARAAIAAGAAGIMVEVHASPGRARSDAKQQMSPAAFVKFLRDLGTSV